MLNIRTAMSTPSLSFVSSALISGFIAAAAAIPLIMEKIRINLGIGYPGIFLIWMIAVAVIQLTKLFFLTPYEMPKDKSEISLYDTSWLLGKFRKSTETEIVVDLKENVATEADKKKEELDSIPFSSILRGINFVPS